MKLGIEKTAMIRVRAGISYALTDAMDEGHCGQPTDELVPLAEKLLEVPQQLIRTALELELREGSVIADRVGETPCVFLAGLHRAERTIADRLMRLASAPLPWRPIEQTAYARTIHLTQPAKENIIPTTRRGAPQGGRHQIGTPAGFGSEQVAGFTLECMAGFVGIRFPVEP
jgi:hypothetical protein